MPPPSSPARTALLADPLKRSSIDLNSPAESPLRSVNSSTVEISTSSARCWPAPTDTWCSACIRKDGDGITTYRQFDSSMGPMMRVRPAAVGTQSQVWEYYNVPACSLLEPPNKYDARFGPAAAIGIGDIRIHEIAYAAAELWPVNTRFSLPLYADADHSLQALAAAVHQQVRRRGPLPERARGGR